MKMDRLRVLKKVLFLLEEEMKHIQRKCFFLEKKINALIEKKKLLKSYLVEYQEKIEKKSHNQALVKASHYQQDRYFLSQLNKALSQQENAINQEKHVFHQVLRLFKLKESKANKIKEMIAKAEQVLHTQAFRSESQKNTDLFNQVTYSILKENSSNTD